MEDKADFYDKELGKWSDMFRYSPAPRLRRSMAMQWLRRLRPGTLLDVGCGNGEFLQQVRRSWPHMRLTGVDISPAVIAANAARNGIGDKLQDLPPVGSTSKYRPPPSDSL